MFIVVTFTLKGRAKEFFGPFLSTGAALDWAEQEKLGLRECWDVEEIMEAISTADIKRALEPVLGSDTIN